MGGGVKYVCCVRVGERESGLKVYLQPIDRQETSRRNSILSVLCACARSLKEIIDVNNEIVNV